MSKNELVGKDTRNYLESIGFPRGDYSQEVSSSTKRFASGGQYGIEIASAQTPRYHSKYIKIFGEVSI